MNNLQYQVTEKEEHGGGREGQEGVNSFSKILKHILNFQQIKLYRLGTQVGKRNTLKNIEGDQNTAWI